MKCISCDSPMDAVSVYDNCGSQKPVAYNVYQCDGCGTLCKEDVWSNAGLTFIDSENNITKIPKDTDEQA